MKKKRKSLMRKIKIAKSDLQKRRRVKCNSKRKAIRIKRRLIVTLKKKRHLRKSLNKFKYNHQTQQ
jgi:hypothetical protein